MTYPEVANSEAILVELCPLPGLSLLDILSSAPAAIIVDALAGSTPGWVHVGSPQDIAAFEAGAGSAHGWGVGETLALGKSIGHTAASVDTHVLAIEGADFELGHGLSSAVAVAIPEAVAKLHEMITGITGEH